MDLEKIIDALVESTKQTIAKEMEKVRVELQQDQRRTIISLAKPAIRRDVDTAIEGLETRLKEMVQSFAPKDGKDGESVNPEKVKELVNSWLAENIKQPEAPTNGLDGVDGRDALQLDILPEINSAKSYVKGTYAQHDGGVFKASRATDPLDGIEPHRAGWDVVLRGVSSIEVHQLDESTFAVKTKMTGGADHITKMAVPAMIYKGVWKESNGEYKKGHTVTQSGSLWVCLADTADKPGSSDSWQLAAKRGTDGKDLNLVKLNRPDTYKLGEK